MAKYLRSQFRNDRLQQSIEVNSDEDVGLNWLGDLLDPWKGSKSGCYQSHLPPLRTYRKVSMHDKKPLTSDSCTQLVHQLQPKQPEAAIKIMDNVIILDDQQNQRFQIELNSEYSERSILLEQNQPIQIIDEEIFQPQYAVEQQHQPHLSWSMIFNHQPSKNKERLEAVASQQAVKQQRKILIADDQNILKIPETKQKQIKDNKSAQDLIFFHKQETVFSNANIFMQGRKRIRGRPKKFFKKLSIPNDLRFQFASNPSSIKGQQRQTIIRKKMTKDQTNISFDLVQYQQNLKKAQNFESQQSEKILIHLQDDQENNVDSQHSIPSQEARFLQISSKVRKSTPKNIVSSQRPLTHRQQQMAKEMGSIIHIIKDRSSGDDYATTYKWEIGSSRYWKTLPDAWQTSFDIFIKKSKKYRAKFLKYLPKDVKSKNQGLGKLERKLNGQQIPGLKREKIRECKVKSKRKEMAQLNDIFNRILMEKVIQYQRLVQQKGRAEAMGQLQDDYLSEYEPDTPYVDVMIEQMVLNANSIKNKRKGWLQQQAVSKKVQATNQLLIHNLSRAADQYNYVESMRSLYKLNKKHSLLSCLDPNSLGLRSNDLKMINKETFETEMRTISLMNQPILVNDMEVATNDQQSHKIEGGPFANKLKLQ